MVWRFEIKALLLLLCSSNVVGLSQEAGYKCGVYATWQDVKMDNPYIEIPCGQRGYTIWPSGFWRHRGIDVILPDTTIYLDTKHIWGYRDHKGRLHRIWGKRHLRVEKHPGLIAYTCTSPILPRRFFSRKLYSEVFPFTPRKLRQVLEREPAIAEQ
jgi:hypothetical protein